jgi:casein kinase 1
MARVLIAGGQYQLIKKIGEGSFGKIFSCKSACETVIAHSVADSKYAVKIMPLAHTTLLKNEVAMYERLKGVKCIPSLYDYGVEGTSRAEGVTATSRAEATSGKFNYMVMDLLEQSLEDLLLNYGGQLPLKVVLHLAVQMLNIVEQIHARGIIHRDLKPANFLLRTNKDHISELYLIDFGLAKSILDDKLRHGEMQTNESLVGTCRYMSVNVHQGLTASRRDDLESLGYIMIFLHQGQLSWQNQASLSAVLEIKQKFGWAHSAAAPGDKKVIGEFVLFILYCRNLGFAEKPNYEYLRQLLLNVNNLL